MVQKRLVFTESVRHGGRRKGAGRKRKGDRMVPHRKRPEVMGGKPVHLTWKVIEGLPSLRQEELLGVIDGCFAGAMVRDGFRIVHWSMMSNHFHVIVEAACRSSMTAGVKGLKVRLARAINRWLGRKGSVFVGRCFEEVLTCARQVRRCVRYVLENAKRHAGRAWVPAGELDPFSSAGWFEGWRGAGARQLERWRRGRRRCVALPIATILRLPEQSIPVA